MKHPLMGTEEQDPSFGLVSISRVSGRRRLFESPFEHQHFITLSIKRATRSRTDLHMNYIGEGEELVEVAMSEVQFASMVTSLNMGVGTPCTIAHWDGKIVKEPAPDQTKKTFEKEAKEHFTDLAKMAAELEKLTGRSPSSLKAADRERMSFLALKIHQAVTSSAEFFLQQFQKSMDKAVAAAKGEVQAHVLNVIKTAGLGAVNPNELPSLELDAEKKERDPMVCQACNEGMHEECTGHAEVGKDVGCACETCFFG